MALSTTLGIIAALVSIAVGVGTAVYFVIKQNDPRTARRVIGITSLVLVVILIVAGGLALAQPGGMTRDASGQSANSVSASSTSATSTVVKATAAPTATATPRPPAPGTVLCHSGVNGNWSGWSLSGDWKLLNGVVLDDGTNQASETMGLIPPPTCQPTTPDYMVQATLKIDQGYAFGIVVRAASSNNGYVGYEGSVIFYDGPPASVRISTMEDSYGSSLASGTYNIGSGWYTFAIKVQGNTIEFMINGGTVAQVTDNRHLNPGQIALWSQQSQLEMNDFKVTAV